MGAFAEFCIVPFLLFLCFLFGDTASPNINTLQVCVDQKEKGSCFSTVQTAVNAVPNYSDQRTIISIHSGIYHEKVMVEKSKANITFHGEGYTKTIIVWNDTAKSANGTYFSGSVQVFAPNFIAHNISFKAPIPSPGEEGAQAVAIRVGGDKAQFYGCGFYGAQDTLHDDDGRHYFKDCYIEGSIDFIFGNARSLFENCQIVSIAKRESPGQSFINGAVTAQGRSYEENTGFVFVNCSIEGNGRILLGRAWGNYSRVIFAFTNMSNIIAPQGWNDFNDPSRDRTVFYGEYKCTGAGADMSMRPSYVQRLSDAQVSPFLTTSYIDERPLSSMAEEESSSLAPFTIPESTPE
ncbi:putative pectinesterase 8 [Senna tora]|uniref:Pectinesterase n=1 Tax=Senna tora TaxID=362788 RepID=A0A834X206_9FABA|nr:putative pectinesterase 8 [Senna tora]